jgi:hypothetical protein
MNPVILEGYRPIEMRWPVYVLDTRTQNATVEWFPSQQHARSARAPVGVGDLRSTGPWYRRTEQFFALFTDGDLLILWIEGRRVNALAPGLSVTRDSDYLLRKRFCVRLDGKLVCDLRYSYLDHEDVPDEDIFAYFARSLATPRDRLRAWLYWSDTAARANVEVDPAAYRSSLDERVAALLRQRG